MTQCFDELDSHGTGEITYDEFRHWWYIRKYGKLRMEKCPEYFLDLLAQKMRTQVHWEGFSFPLFCLAWNRQLCTCAICLHWQAYDIGDVIIPHGCYGRKLGIILQGRIRLWRDRQQKR